MGMMAMPLIDPKWDYEPGQPGVKSTHNPLLQ